MFQYPSLTCCMTQAKQLLLSVPSFSCPIICLTVFCSCSGLSIYLASGLYCTKNILTPAALSSPVFLKFSSVLWQVYNNYLPQLLTNMDHTAILLDRLYLEVLSQPLTSLVERTTTKQIHLKLSPL